MNMDTLLRDCFNILDFPDEVLLSIFSKLNMTDVLYSLTDVNERFNQLVFDPLYIHNLDLTVRSSLNSNFSLNNQVLDRICQCILHRIHHQIKKLTCEEHSLERILLTTDYPRLDSLSLVNFSTKTFVQYLTGHSILRHLLADQITSLVVNINDRTSIELSDENQLNLLSLILSLGKHLRDLDFSIESSNRLFGIQLFHLSSTSCVSSNLVKLKIEISSFDDCLFLLDGRLPFLCTLIVLIVKITVSLSRIDNTNKLPRLKCFSLISTSRTIYYNRQIVPLLQRMINLEELTLLLSVLRLNSGYIDGTDLDKEILSHMPRLNKFTFSLNSHIVNENVTITYPSNENIQASFAKIDYDQMACYADFNSTTNQARCHVYSLPYAFDIFVNLNNSFPGGIFKKVRYLLMHDESPFEYPLFQLVSKDFPYLENLYLHNRVPPKTKYWPTLIEFPHLLSLYLTGSHVDYAEQLLSTNNTRLPRLQTLTIEYQTLAMITDSFTNDTIRSNCAHLQTIQTEDLFVRPENFQQYFPLL